MAARPLRVPTEHLGPNTAADIETQRSNDIGSEACNEIVVVVFDLSRPDARAAKPRRKENEFMIVNHDRRERSEVVRFV